MQHGHSAKIALHYLPITQQSAGPRARLSRRELCKRVHRATSNSERNDRDGPGERRVDRHPINDALNGRLMIQEAVRVLFGYEQINHLEIAAASRAQSRHSPSIVDHYIAAIEVAAQRRLILPIGVLKAGQSHEARRMMRATPERPAARDPVAAFYSECHRTRGCRTRHESTLIREPVSCDGRR